MPAIMTLKDLADYLRMNERTVAKLAQEGKVPGLKVASQWRFLKETIDTWLAQEIQKSGVSAEAPLERPMVWSLLLPEAVELDLKSRTKDGVLAEMTEMLAASKRISTGTALLAALRERERLCSTGVGRGVAFLHPRRVVAEMAREPVLAFGRSVQGVEWEAVDGAKVHLFFLDCTPSDRLHLALLARLSRLLADDSLVAGLRNAMTSGEAIQAIRQAEEALGQSRP